ncbi:hypothetical protein C2E23DRAFT_942275, partial [Lenzites betulinus]
ALLGYEYVITFDQEVALFWKPKITGATILFLGTRYTALLSNNFLLTATFARMSDQYASNSFQYVFWAAFSGLRVLALSGMNRPLSAVVFILALAPFAVNTWPLALQRISGGNDPILGCEGIENNGYLVRHSFDIFSSVILSRGCLIIADMLAVVVTWASWRKTRGVSSAVLRTSVPTLSNVLIYNGQSSSHLVVVCNVLHLTLTLISIATPYEETSVVTSLTDPLTTILVCRFLLDLQRANQAMLGRSSMGPQLMSGDSEGPSGPRQHTLRFASSVMGSISQSLTMVDEELDLDALEDCEMENLKHVAEPDTASSRFSGLAWEDAKDPGDGTGTQSTGKAADRVADLA